MKKKTRRYIRRFLRALPVVLLPAISGFILGPLEIMAGNTKNFEFSMADVMPAFCITGLLVTIVLSLIITLLPEKIGRYAKGMILAGGLCGYIQYMFMNVKLSEEDGASMDWSSLGNFPVINLIIWIAIAAAVIFTVWRFKKKWNKYAAWFAAALCVVQLSAVVSVCASTVPEKTEVQYQLVGDGQYQVSKDENIIVFVLDTFGSTTMDNVLRKYPDALNCLKDFTYYTNTDCRYYCTFPSLTHMLTGRDFNFDMNSQDWLDEAWNSERADVFFNQLKKAGYKSYLYSYTNNLRYIYGGAKNLYGKFENVMSGNEKDVDVKLAVKLLLKMSIYRYTPYVIKPYFEVYTHEFANTVKYENHEQMRYENTEYYNGLKQNGLTLNAEAKKSFIVQHVQGVHSPYTLTANAEYIEKSNTTEVGRGLLRIMEDYLNQLKQLGVYDKSTIIILADHGGGRNGNPQSIFFIKRSNEHGDEVRTNNAPVSLMDFQATILSLLGVDYTEFGKSVFDWKEDDLRERTVYMRGTDENYPPVKGSSFNVYYSYTYTGDREALNEQVNQGNVTVLSATPW